MKEKLKTLDEILKKGDKHIFMFAINERMHETFKLLSNDRTPVHNDNNFAKDKGFMKKIGYGFLLDSVLSHLYGEVFGRGHSICLKQTSNFLKPYYLGDKLNLIAEVLSVSGNGVVEIKTDILNEKKEKIFEGIGHIKLLSGRI